MTDDGAADGAFNYLSRYLAPLVVDPISISNESNVRLRGFARVGDQRARVALSADLSMTTGVAFEYNLIADGQTLDVPAAIGSIRRAASCLVTNHWDQAAVDGQGNSIGIIPAADFSEIPDDTARAHFFFLISVLETGGGFPWFEEDMAFCGFMYSSLNQARLYMRRGSDRTVIGIDIPLRTSAGVPLSHTALPHELISVMGSDVALRALPRRPLDHYCSQAVDFAAWLGHER